MLKFLALPLTLLTLIALPAFGQSTLGGGTVGIPGLTTNAVRERHLKAVDSPADEECLTYEDTVGDFEWQNCIAGALTEVVEDTTPQYGGPMDTNGHAIKHSEGPPAASDTTTDIWAVDGNTIHVTGVTTITSFGTAPRVGASRAVIFDGALILTHSANLALPGGANITTAAGDIAFIYADSTIQFDVLYARVDGTALAIAANSIDFTEIVDAATLDGNFSIAVPAANNIVIDSRTAPSTHTQGIMRYEHTAGAVNTRVIELEVDAASFPSTHAVRADLHATALAPGEGMIGYHVSADTSTSTGGMIEAIRVDKAGAGSADVHALHVDPGVAPIHQESGTFGALESAWENAVEVTSELNDTGTDLTLFSSNSDILYIGDAAAFNALEVNLDTEAGGAGIKPTFEFSNDGGGGWDTFTPIDGTDGFRETSIIEWSIADLTNWQTDTVNAVANKFWIRITRTQPSIPVDPIEDTIQISVTDEFGWDEDGNLTIGAIDASGTVIQDGGDFASSGDARSRVLILRNSTTDVTQTEIFTDGSSGDIAVASDCTLAFRVSIVARRTDADNESAVYLLVGGIDNNAGTTALVGAVSKSVIAEDTSAWDVTATADDANDSINILVTGENAKTIRWVARAETTEVCG